jgi:hypothetical protein
MEARGQLKARPLYPRGKGPRDTPDKRLGEPRIGLGAVEKRKILHCRKSPPRTPWSRILYVKLILARRVKKMSALYEIR